MEVPTIGGRNGEEGERDDGVVRALHLGIGWADPYQSIATDRHEPDEQGDEGAVGALAPDRCFRNDGDLSSDGT